MEDTLSATNEKSCEQVGVALRSVSMSKQACTISRMAPVNRLNLDPMLMSWRRCPVGCPAPETALFGGPSFPNALELARLSSAWCGVIESGSWRKEPRKPRGESKQGKEGGVWCAGCGGAIGLLCHVDSRCCLVCACVGVVG